MGAVQSDLKSKIVQASAGNVTIPPSLADFWQTFWQRPETAEHVFETITPSDIRNMRDNPQNFKNLETLILTVSQHLVLLRWTADSLCDKDTNLGKEVLNCVRILTRILPFIYESDDLRDWEQRFFWEQRDLSSFRRMDRHISGESASADTLHASPDASTDDASSLTPQPETTRALGRELVDSLLDLAFWSGFTLPSNATGRNGPTYGFWQSGIAYERRLDTSKEFESRRTEILQLLLTLESKSIYGSSNDYLQHGAEAVECISNHSDRKKVQYLLCSILNTVLKYQPDARYIRYGESPREVHETHVRTCLDFLLVNLLNRSPWDDELNPAPSNRFRDLFSHLHKATHLQFLADGILKILRQPLEASTNALQIVQRPLTWAHEIIPLLYEALYSNKYFRAFVCETGRQFELVVFLLFYILEPNLKMEGVVRVSVLCIQAMSEVPEFALSLNKPFDGHDNLPSFMQIRNFHGSHSDYLITWLLTLLKPDNNGRMNVMSASLVGVIVNVSPYVIKLGRATSLKMVQVLDSASRDPVLASAETNAMVTSNLVQAIDTLVSQHKTGHENLNVLWAVWRYGRMFEHLAELRAKVDIGFKSMVEVLRKGISEPMISQDGTILMPLVEAKHIADLNERSRPRLNRKSRTWDEIEQRRSPAVSPAPSTAPGPGPLSTQTVPTSLTVMEKAASAKAQGKKPEQAAAAWSDESKIASAPLAESALATIWYQQMPLSTTLSLIIALDAWAAYVVSERGVDLTHEALEDLTMTDVLQPVRDLGSTCLEPSEPRLHKFVIQPPFTAMYAAFYWGLVASQDVERAAASGSGIWSSTKIKLFRIKAGRVQAPSLFSPKGAVDAVGESLVTGLQNLTIKARQGLAGANGNEA